LTRRPPLRSALALACALAAASSLAAAGPKSLRVSSFSGSSFAKIVDERLFAELNLAFGKGYDDYLKNPGACDFNMPGLFADIAKGANDKVAKAIKAGDDISGYYLVYAAKDPMKSLESRGAIKSPKYLYSALMAAALFGNVEAARLLLDAGADVNARHDRFHHGALECALMGRSPSAELVSLLVERGADRESAGRALILAAAIGRADLCSALLAAGADPNARNDDVKDPRQTALLVASGDANLEIVRLLLAAGANPNLASEHGKAVFDELLSLGYAGKSMSDSWIYYADSMSTVYSSGSGGFQGAVEDFGSGKYTRDHSTPPLQRLLGRDGIAPGGGQSDRDPSMRDRVVPVARELVKAGAELEHSSIPALESATVAGFYDAAVFLIGVGASLSATDYRGANAFQGLLDDVRFKFVYKGDAGLAGPIEVMKAMLDSTMSERERDALKILMRLELNDYRSKLKTFDEKARVPLGILAETLEKL
jgi:hypothetical protein